MKLFSKLAIVIILLFSYSCNNKSTDNTNSEVNGDLIIFHAGSLSVPFKQITKEFNKEYPDVNVMIESAGSRKCARKITDLNKECDIMASADYKVIENLLIPDFADWNIKFASNEMAIVYNEKSRYKDEINKDNWFDILLKEDVAYGRSDPNADPCGYRAVLVNKLAEKYYKKEGLSSKILEKDNNYIRPKETDLLALLESNTIDYIFLYRSVAQQHGLKYIVLPDNINLKKTELADFYSTVTVDISGKKPGEKITKKGEAMVYGITVLKNAKNKKAAKAFIEFFLNEKKGMKIMESNGQPSVIPAKSKYYNNIPEYLKKYAKQ
ncbi:MAG: tungstate ABC transporter substrate-binding protein WtpA [Bacteroidales bacterium]|jgi:molybdate/tungstate transport system substrate-binding protein|nr:tungstate ABC transporter substrate-binding protein WtpA [Bacteroidales bacterium]